LCVCESVCSDSVCIWLFANYSKYLSIVKVSNALTLLLLQLHLLLLLLLVCVMRKLLTFFQYNNCILCCNLLAKKQTKKTHNETTKTRTRYELNKKPSTVITKSPLTI